ncbi:MAG: cation:proton antiporter [Candidatus Bathyarchaeota archaeon]|nr:cation:proton antiporter [Candidatus Bathyarchaeota archaeon]
MIDAVYLFVIAAAIILIGFLANILFKKTGWPEILFLILIGIILGPVLKVFSNDGLLPIIPVVSTFTLLMVLFSGGMELRLSDIASGGFRSLIQAAAYFGIGLISTAIFTYVVLGWQIIDGLLLGSIISQIGTVVVIPMVKKLGVRGETAALLSIESAIGSILSIIFFFAFLTTKLSGTFAPISIVGSIGLKLVVGLILGVILALPWIRVLFELKNNELAYIATLGYILACYAFSEFLLGSGALTILGFGVILGNYKQIFRLLNVSPSRSFTKITNYLMRFQKEVSFILRAFFFVMLGLLFDISPASIVTGLSIAIPIVSILILARYAVASFSTRKSSMASDKKIIVGMCAHGLTPALLALTLLQYNFSNAYLFPLIVTNIIIVTNIVTSIASLIYRQNGANLVRRK